uniref:BTB_2 domain-containing protein n=1 Tax=Strongyloides papillosus TaxID=174720 RepID=A0A0N5BHU1_STREA
MSYSIKVSSNDDGKICVDGKKANAKIFSEYIKGSSTKKYALPADYKIIIYHHGTPYTIDGNLIASKSEFVLGLTKLFKSPLQLDFSDCSQNAIERVIHYLKTGDDDFDPLEVSAIYDIIVKLDIRPLRMSLRRRIDNAIVGMNIERKLGPVRSRSSSKAPKNGKRGIQEYKKCFDEIYDLLQAIDKFNGKIETVAGEKSTRGRSVKRSVSKKQPSKSKSLASGRGRSNSRGGLKSINSFARTESIASRKSRSISKKPKNDYPKHTRNQSKGKESVKGGKKDKMLRDLSQLSGSGRKNIPKEESKKVSKSRRRYKGKGKQSNVQKDPSLSPYQKKVADDGIITIAPYFNQNNVFAKNGEYFNDNQSNPPSSFTTDASELSTPRSSRSNNNKIDYPRHKGFKNVKRSEGFNTWLARKNKEKNDNLSKAFPREQDNGQDNVYF